MSRSACNSSSTHLCPWWFIRVFDNPLRRLVQKPGLILRKWVKAGDTCLDVGCGFGYFSIPMARMVGDSGLVIAADVQPQMLAGVKRRAEKADVVSRIRLVQVDGSALQIDDAIDFALAFWMMHEVPDQEAMFRSIRRVLGPSGRFLPVEPKGHVRAAAFRREVATAESVGFVRVSEPRISLSHAVLMAGVDSEPSERSVKRKTATRIRIQKMRCAAGTIQPSVMIQFA